MAKRWNWSKLTLLIATLWALSSCSNPLQMFQDHSRSTLSYASVEPVTGGPFPPPGDYTAGQEILVASGASLTRTNYSFVRWNTQSDGKGSNFVAGQKLVMPPFAVTLFAQWGAVGAITYDGNHETGGQPPTDAGTYVVGDPVTVQANLNGLFRASWKFSGWNTRADGQGTLYTPGQTFAYAQPVTLWARWSSPSETTATITYNLNNADSGTVPVDPVFYLPGASALLAGAGDIVRVSYTLDGWNTKSDGTGNLYALGSTVTMGSASLPLFAKWTLVGSHTVTYDGNSQMTGNPPVDSNTYLVSQPVTILGNVGTPILHRSGMFEFTGWNTLSTGLGTHYSAGDIMSMPGNNVVLFAEWSNYSLAFDGNGADGGVLPANMGPYITGSTAIMPPGPTRTGFAFAGWNEQADGLGLNTLPGFNYTMPSHNVVLHAKWDPVITVTYDANSATSGVVPVGPAVYNSGDTVTAQANSAALSRNGYTFNGWNTQADGHGTHYNVGATFTMPVTNVILYADWISHITYDPNGADGGGGPPVDPTDYHSGDPAGMLSNANGMTRTGYVFVGWNGNASQSGQFYKPFQGFTMGADFVVYAQWQPVGNYFVDGTTGNDGNNGLSPATAFKTMHHAFTVVSGGQTVSVLPGTYSTATNGETFPLVIPTTINVVGNVPGHGANTIVQGGGDETIVNSVGLLSATFIAATGSTLTGFTITNTAVTAANNVGVYLHATYGADSLHIEKNHFTGSQGDGLYVAGGLGGTLSANTFDANTGRGVVFTGGGGSNMSVSDNTFNDEVEVLSDGPDFGGGAASSPGHNSWMTFHNLFSTDTTVYVQNNDWSTFTPTAGVLGVGDYTVTGATIVDTTGATQSF